MTKQLAVVLKADSQIGTGHLMRIRNLLPYLPECTFTLYTDSLAETLKSLTYEYSRIVRGSLSELPALIAADRPKLVLIDHYYVDESFEKPLYERCKVAVIDDLANRRHCCHALFDQGMARKENDYLPWVNPQCKLYCGSAYSMVRPQFAAVNRLPHAGRPRVLVSYGGADPVHACLRVARSILQGRLNERYEFVVLCGAANQDYAALKELLGAASGVELLQSSTDVPALFARCDLALGACGGMFSERLCAGLPAISTVIADNQEGADLLVQKLRLGLTLTLEELQDPVLVERSLDKLWAGREDFAAAGRALFDGQGLSRIARALLKLIPDHQSSFPES